MNRQSNKITAIYARAGKGGYESLAIVRQRQTLTQYAQDHGLDNIEIFVDSGFNGTSDFRPAFQMLLNAIERGEVANLVVLSLDRLYRDSVKCGDLVTETLSKYDVALYAVKDAISPKTPLVYFFPALSSFVGGEQ